jgi:hypothetical protein
VEETAIERTESVVIAWEAGDSPGEIELIVSRSESEALLADLADRGVPASRKQQTRRSSGSSLLDVVVATVHNAAMWAALGLSVRAFLNRNRGKKLQIGQDGRTTATDYSARDIERILRALAEVPENDSPETGS